MIDVTLLHGDCREVLKTLPDQSVNCCVTSPPYYGLRDYGVAGQMGLEATPQAFIAELVAVFREVSRVLRDDGTLWLNLGDSYGSGKGTCFNPGGGSSSLGKSRKDAGAHPLNRGNKSDLLDQGLKPKDLLGIPWRVAFALQADGWYLRQDIIWHKPNPMPESVTDRCTKAHEYIFLLSKSARYFYDAEAIKEPVTGEAHRRAAYKTPDGWDTTAGNGGHGSFHKDGREKGRTGYVPKSEGRNSRMHVERAAGRQDSKPNSSRSAVRDAGVTPKSVPAGSGIKANDSFQAAITDLVTDRNKRSVWTVATAPYKAAHFATFPPALITPCILAGCPQGGGSAGSVWRQRDYWHGGAAAWPQCDSD
jgi:site-specific DNA-methyltransferase (adenine-specific)